ncbi:MAG TPA: hypothetical protein VJ933_02460, partial [Phaeodactylibacter sp.]|nr:hypothetical protein [Phaeodactylibacter sp.]
VFEVFSLDLPQYSTIHIPLNITTASEKMPNVRYSTVIYLRLYDLCKWESIFQNNQNKAVVRWQDD